MHQLFAVEPELIPEWSEPRNFRYFWEAFAPDAGRLVARFPKHWIKLVEGHLSTLGPKDLLRATELRKRLGTLLVRRPGHVWKEGRWLESAIEEHAARPFRAILATANPTSHRDVLIGANLDPDDPKWIVLKGQVVPQTRAWIVGCAKFLIESSRELVLVDPYFDPQFPKWRDVLHGLLECRSGRAAGDGPFRCRYHVRADRATTQEFVEDCEQFLPALIPEGVRLTVLRWEPLARGDKPHARYIMTERGGISVDGGLDEKPGETTDVRILEEAIWRRRWEEFREGGTPPFRLVDQWSTEEPAESRG